MTSEPPSTSSDSLDGSLTITESKSVSEDDRQRILEGILAEDDDVDDVDIVASAKMDQLPSKQTEQLPHKVARKRVESENAFSSSSDDDDDCNETTNLEGIYTASADPIMTSSIHLQQSVEDRQRWSKDPTEFRSNELMVMSEASGINTNDTVSSNVKHLEQSSFDCEKDEPRTAFPFDGTSVKMADAAGTLANPINDTSNQQQEQKQQTAETKPADDYLTQAEHQVIDEILSNEINDDESTTPDTEQQNKANKNSLHKSTKTNPILWARQKPNSVTGTTNISPIMMIDTSASTTLESYYKNEEERESMRRTFQQSISAAVLVSLAHKRYERRRLAAMEIEKVIRTLVSNEDYSRVRAILLLLSDDYVRSTNEDARKGGVVALAACAIGLKKASLGQEVMECRDLILANVVHACQDHSQRVRYYATESLFNVTKVIPSLAVQHFFILFEILRSLYADVDLDVRSGAELLDKKLKEVIVGAINSGSFSADACVPVFARFVYMRNKATKQLTLTWLQEFSDKLIGAPILEFLHLFLGGIFAMVSDPNTTIRQLALDFLQLVLPKLLVNNEDFEDGQHMAIDFDKILQNLVVTMEHPDPFVRKVAMYWMSRIVQAHISGAVSKSDEITGDKLVKRQDLNTHLTAASISVRNALPHVLPGILLSIGDTHQSRTKDQFLSDHTAHSLAEQANSCLQDAVRCDGKAFIPHLGGFIVALRDELDSPGGLLAKNPPSVERRPYRMDVKPDGSGIESTGWFRASDGIEERDNALILSRLCALQWIVVLYEYVVPNSLKAGYASEFVDCIIYQLVDQPPGIITVKSFEVLAKISIPSDSEASPSNIAPADNEIPSMKNPMNDDNTNFALGVLDLSRRKLISRNRDVFSSLIDLHSKHPQHLVEVSKVIELMCTLQPPEFVFVAFANELDNFVVSRMKHREKVLDSPKTDAHAAKKELSAFAKDLAFISNFAQQLGIVFFAAPETEVLRDVLKDCIGRKGNSIEDERKARLFYILLHAFSHNIVATLSLCLWGGAYRTAANFLKKIDPLDVSLMFYLEIDQLIDLIERPLFRHLQLRLLECEDDPHCEGSGLMLFFTLKRILMLLPQSTSYTILQERLSPVARYRQSAVFNKAPKPIERGSETDVFLKQIVKARRLHVWAKWRMIRAESLEEESCRIITDEQRFNAQQQRREWVGYADEEEELATKQTIKDRMLGNTSERAELVGVYERLDDIEKSKSVQYQEVEEAFNECDACLTESHGAKDVSKEHLERESSSDVEATPQWREFWNR